MNKWLSSKWIPLGFFILILQILAFMTSFFLTKNAVSTWYQALNKSPLTPPDWAFPAVWTILYTLIAISLWIIWQNRQNPAHKQSAKPALIAYALQLALNYAWSPVFFGLRAFDAAFYLSLIMVVAIAANIYLAGKINKIASALLIPYWLWTCFAAHLTFYVMTHN